MENIIEVKNIQKSFPGVLALNDVSISVRKNTVHAIVGENGAGKSTLMKILGGVYPQDSGEIFVKGQKTVIKNVDDSHKAGIRVIFQEFNLMPELTVAENLYVSNLPTKGPFVDYATLNKKAEALLSEFGIDIAPETVVKDLSVSKKQMVEVAKALSGDADIIIMDEPTATLNNNEVATLYSIIAKLKEAGKTILYISHRMKEIFELSDYVTVLRDGKYIDTKPTAQLTDEEIVFMMIGRDVDSYYSTARSEIGDVALEVKGLCKEGVMKDVSFQVHKGEILGVAGLMGSGREEIIKAIFGLIPLDSGEVYVDGKKVNIRSPKDAIANGIAFVTDDRKEEGIFELMGVMHNLTMNVLPRVCEPKHIWLSNGKQRVLLDKYTQLMNMKYASPTQQIVNLSGGNQQKFLLGRSLATDGNVLLLLEPTRGIDVGAKAEIYALLGELAKSGMGIVVVSSDLPEILSLCHKTLVVWQGILTGELEKDEMSENAIMLCATGVNIKAKEVRQ